MDSLDSAFPKRQLLDSSKLKVFAEDNFKFNENGRKFSKWVENTVERGETACLTLSQMKNFTLPHNNLSLMKIA